MITLLTSLVCLACGCFIGYELGRAPVMRDDEDEATMLRRVAFEKEQKRVADYNRHTKWQGW